MGKVEIIQVKKSFGSTEVLQSVDLTIQTGEFVVLVGPSGCGKSTLLRMVAGLDVPSAGTISIDGQIVNDVAPKERGVSMVFQNYALYPHMTVRQNLEFGLKISGVAKEEIAKRVAQASEILGLDSQLAKKPGQLSGGQKQRVAMGRAIVRQPKVFLFDEPLSNLDAQLRVKMRSEISLLHRRLNSTSIYVTHDQVEAMTLADRIAVMNKGRLEQVGTPLELYRNPQTQFVASFIGTPQMNFIAKDLLPKALTPATATVAGFRPEVTKLELGAAQDSVSLGKALVQLVEPLGLTSYLHLKLGDSSLIAEVRTETLPVVGREVGVWVNGAQIFYFDSAGRRV